VRDGRADGALLLGKTLNVSSNGLLVEIESAIAIGRVVEIEFFLPTTPSPEREGPDHAPDDRARPLPPAFGIRFTEISEKDQARIDSFVAERERAGFRG